MAILIYLYEGAVAAWDWALDFSDALQLLIILRRAFRYVKQKCKTTVD